MRTQTQQARLGKLTLFSTTLYPTLRSERRPLRRPPTPSQIFSPAKDVGFDVMLQSKRALQKCLHSFLSALHEMVTHLGVRQRPVAVHRDSLRSTGGQHVQTLGVPVLSRRTAFFWHLKSPPKIFQRCGREYENIPRIRFSDVSRLQSGVCLVLHVARLHDSAGECTKNKRPGAVRYVSLSADACNWKNEKAKQGRKAKKTTNSSTPTPT